jgi:hypothetical protein
MDLKEEFNGKNLTYIGKSSSTFNGILFQWNRYIVKVLILFDNQKSEKYKTRSLETFHKDCKAYTALHEKIAAAGWDLIPSIQYFELKNGKDYMKPMKPHFDDNQIVIPHEFTLGVVCLGPITGKAVSVHRFVGQCTPELNVRCLAILYELWKNGFLCSCSLNDFVIQSHGDTHSLHLVDFYEIDTTEPYGLEEEVGTFMLFKQEMKKNSKLSENRFEEIDSIPYESVTNVHLGEKIECKQGVEPARQHKGESRDTQHEDDEPVEDDQDRTRLQYVADGFQFKGARRAKTLYGCVHDPERTRTKKEKKRCDRLKEKYPESYFRYFHAWKSRGGRRRHMRTRRRTRR